MTDIEEFLGRGCFYRMPDGELRFIEPGKRYLVRDARTKKWGTVRAVEVEKTSRNHFMIQFVAEHGDELPAGPTLLDQIWVEVHD